MKINEMLQVNLGKVDIHFMIFQILHLIVLLIRVFKEFISNFIMDVFKNLNT